MTQVRTWWFKDTVSGEEFFVETRTNSERTRSAAKAKAERIARKYFNSPRLVAQISLASAETMGLDTYTD